MKKTEEIKTSGLIRPEVQEELDHMFRGRHLNIKTLLMLIAAATVVVIQLIQSGYQVSALIGEGNRRMSQISTLMLDAKKNQLKTALENALGELQSLYERGGTQADAISLISSLRYNEGAGYFSVYADDGTLIWNPDQSMINKNMSSSKDINGVYVVQESIKIAKTQGRGFLDYYWPKTGEVQPQPKKSYIVYFAPWRWTLNTGIYIDDVIKEVAVIDARTKADVRNKVIVSVLISVFSAAIMLLIVNFAFSRFVTRRIASMSALIRGYTQDDQKLGSEIEVLRKDELGALAIEFRDFVRALRREQGTIIDSQRIANQLNESIIKNAPIGIYTINTKGVITSQNSAVGRIMRNAGHDFVGQNFFDIKETEPFYNEVKQAINGTPVYADRICFRIPDADVVIFANVWMAPLFIEGKVDEVLVLQQDVTEQVTAEQTLQQERKELQDTNKKLDRKNHLFQVLLETSTYMLRSENLEEAYNNILTKIARLFPDYSLGIILEGARPEILEYAAFCNLPDKECKNIIENRRSLLEMDIGEALFNDYEPLQFTFPGEAGQHQWTIWPFLTDEEKQYVHGKLMIRGIDLDRESAELIRIFLDQLEVVSKNKLLSIQLERMANRDGLTGVYNRAYFDRELTRVIEASRKYPDTYFSVLVIDVNGLKRVNDLFGHQAGDAMIIKVAVMFNSICRDSDTMARVGGDEFVMLLPSTRVKDIDSLMKRIRENESKLEMICEYSDEKQETVPIRMSIGISGSDEVAPEEVLKKADERMYADKERYYAKNQRYR